MIDSLQIPLSLRPFPRSFQLWVPVDPVSHVLWSGKFTDHAPARVSEDTTVVPLFVAWRFPHDEAASLEWFLENEDWLRKIARQRMIAPSRLNRGKRWTKKTQS